MEVEEKTPAKELTKQKENSYGRETGWACYWIVREELKSFTASRLLKFEKRIQVREASCIHPNRTDTRNQGEKCLILSLKFVFWLWIQTRQQ